MKKNPKIRFAESKYGNDDSYINITPIILTAILAFIFCQSVSLFLLFHEIHLMGHVIFPLPDRANPAAQQILGFYQAMIGLIPHLKTDTANSYYHWMNWLDQRGQWERLGVRWLLSIVCGFYGSYKAIQLTWYPTENEIQTRGRVLVEGDDAFDTLQKDLAAQNQRERAEGVPPAFIMETRDGFNPNDPSSYEVDEADRIDLPNAMRLPHILLSAGSRRGKTQKVMKLIMEFIYRITHLNEIIKVFLVDTGKGDYSKFIPKSMCHIIAPHQKNSLKWAIGKDLKLVAHAEEFWKGKIPDNEKQPFWSDAPRAIGVSSNAILIKTCGDDWSFNNMAFYLKSTPEQLTPFIQKYYPEATQIIQMGGEVLSNILGSTETASNDLLKLAQIWDGYDYKHDISQMSVRLLKSKYPDNIDFLAESRLPQVIYENGEVKQILTQNITPNLILRGLIRHLNSTMGNNDKTAWKWSDLVDVLMKPYREIVALAVPHLVEVEQRTFINQNNIDFMKSLVNVSGVYKEFKSESDIDKHVKALCNNIVLLERILKTLILHAKSYPNQRSAQQVIDNLMKNWTQDKNGEILELMAKYLRSNELTSMEGHDDHKILINAAKPIFENYKIWDRYESIPTFSLNEWLRDENPKKKFFVLKTSGQFSTITSPLVRGMLYYTKSIVDDDMFMDDRDLGITRRFYFLMDEFQALGNIKTFIEAALERFASKGCSVILAFQDISQCVQVYSQEFVDFLLANTGNVFFLGSNIGKTTDMISNMVGKKWFKKLHTSWSSQKDGTSISRNWQEHEGLVITPDEVNSKLGIDFQGLPKKSFWQWVTKVDARTLPIRYLYLGSGLNKAYILQTPVVKYKLLNKPEPADWTDPNNPVFYKLENGDKMIKKALEQGDEKVVDVSPANRWTSVDADVNIVTLDEQEQQESYSLSDEETTYLERGLNNIDFNDDAENQQISEVMNQLREIFDNK